MDNVARFDNVENELAQRDCKKVVLWLSNFANPFLTWDSTDNFPDFFASASPKQALQGTVLDKDRDFGSKRQIQKWIFRRSGQTLN